jgi:hypothetical protein
MNPVFQFATTVYLEHAWLVLTLMLTAEALLAGHGKIGALFRELTDFWKNKNHMILLAAAAVSIVLSLRFTGPETVEQAVESFILLLLFFAGMWRLGKCFFEGEAERIGFFLVVTVLYWMTAWMDGRAEATGIFLNSRNGLTVLSCLVFPITLAAGLEWLKADGRHVRRLIGAVGLVLSGQLCYRNGGLYVLLMLFLFLAVDLVRRGYRHGRASGFFKKHL